MCADCPRFCFPCLMNQTQGPIYRQESVSTPLSFVRKRLYQHCGRGAMLFDVLKGASLCQRCGGRLWCRRSVFRFALTHGLTRMEECSVCSVTPVMWLLSLFVMLLTLTSPRGPACHTNKWFFLLCIVHFLKRGYFWTREAKTSCNEWCNLFPVSINRRRSNAWARNTFMHS